MLITLSCLRDKTSQIILAFLTNSRISPELEVAVTAKATNSSCWTLPTAVLSTPFPPLLL